MWAPSRLPTGVQLLIVLLQTAEQLYVSLDPPLAVMVSSFPEPEQVTMTMLWTCVRRPLVVMFLSLSRPRKEMNSGLTGRTLQRVLTPCVRLVVLLPDLLDEHTSGTETLHMPLLFIVLVVTVVMSVELTLLDRFRYMFPKRPPVTQLPRFSM